MITLSITFPEEISTVDFANALINRKELTAKQFSAMLKSSKFYITSISDELKSLDRSNDMLYFSQSPKPMI